MKNYNKGLIYTGVKECIDCNKCIHECPILRSNVSVKSDDDTYKISVDDKECILCGTCMDTCVHNARYFKDDFDEFFSELKQGKTFSVLVAPAFYLSYPKEYRHIFGYLKSLGVKNFYAVGFGADITIWGYLNYIARHNAVGKIAQPCPSVVQYIEKHLPELLPNLMPIQSPMMCTAIYLKRYKGIKEDIVFLSPCIAKKVEIESKRGQGLIRHNITFKNLKDHIIKNNVDIGSYSGVDEEMDYGMGSLFPKPGGLRENIEYYLGPEASVIQVEGEHRAYDYLRRFSVRLNKQAESIPALVDILNCDRGCSHGTGTEFRKINGDDDEVSYQAILMRRKKYAAMKDENQNILLEPSKRLARLNENFKDLKLEDFMCEYDSESAVQTIVISDSKIDLIFKVDLLKFTENDKNIDCSACGYKTCRDMAKAIAYEISHRSKCIYYVKNSLAMNMEKLSAAEERLRIIIDNMPLVSNFRNRNFEILECNEEVKMLFDLHDKSEYIERFHELSPRFQPDGTLSKEKDEAMLTQAFRIGQARFEWLHQKLDGELINCEVTLIRVKWHDEDLILSFTRDVRELYRYMETERVTQQRLQVILDSSPLFCAVFDRNGNVLDANQASLDFFGFSSKQEYIDNFYNLSQKYQPSGMSTRETILLLVNKLISTGERTRIEWMQQTLAGEPRPIEVTLVPVKMDGRDRIIAHARDLREQYKLMEMQNEVQQRLNAMLNVSPMLCAIFDDDFNITEVNQEAANMLRLTNKQEYIEKFFELSPEYQPDGKSSREKCFGAVTETLKTGRGYVPEWVHKTYDGELIPVEVHLERVKLGEKNVVIVYARDLREQKDMLAKLEEAVKREQAASHAKSRFLSNMSHEIRTPMNAIIGMTGIAKTSSDPERKNDCLDKIDRASNHLLGIINQILDMSKIEAGKFVLNSHAFDLEKAINEVTSVLSINIDEKRLVLDVKLDANIPRIIVSDELRLMQVITNLLSNAIKFTPEGGVVAIKATRQPGSDDAENILRIEVTDTGIGISKEQQSRLFHAFEQAEAGITRKYGGTGLGLVISKRIIGMMGGKIWLESELGKGTTFILTVPFEAGDISEHSAGDENAAAQPQEIENYCYSGHTVLVVEDVEINREIIMAVLEPAGLNIECAENGVQALQMFNDAPDRYSMIFMDLQMPQMDGLTASRRIRDSGKDSAKTVPIIAMTANVFQEDIDTCIAAGMNGHLGKPLDFEQVMEKLKQYMPSKHPLPS